MGNKVEVRTPTTMFGSLTTFPPACPPTPPDEAQIPIDEPIIELGLHVISTEARALVYLSDFYAKSWDAQVAFSDAVRMIARTATNKGKLIICGIGKSGKIGEKLVATFNSLSIPTVFLHPSEALHGDFGLVGSVHILLSTPRRGPLANPSMQDDMIVFITFSGKTAELLAILPHLPDIPKVVVSAHTEELTCKLLNITKGLLLPAPIHEPEEVSFGVPAPTTSTTVALALGDALAIAASKYLHTTLSGKDPKDVFSKNHPGGAIGAKFAAAISQG